MVSCCSNLDSVDGCGNNYCCLLYLFFYFLNPHTILRRQGARKVEAISKTFLAEEVTINDFSWKPVAYWTPRSALMI
jgi:hypothetical protein